MKKYLFSEHYPNFPFRLPMLLDGATGTEMLRAGMPSGVCPEEWILAHPDALISLQKQYIKAGSDAVLAPTFGANRIILQKYSSKILSKTINTDLAALSQSAKSGTKCLIGGDISPTGRFLSPVGDMDFDELVSVYAEQTTALDAHIDFYFIETNMDLAAVRAAVTAAKECSDKPVFVTMTVTPNGKTMSGDTPAACFLTLADLGISAFGLNCSSGPREMLSFLKPLVPLSLSLGIPLIAKPNAGAPDSSGTHTQLTIEAFAKAMSEMLACGIGILGGCCGTDMRHIAALREIIDRAGAAFPQNVEPLVSALFAASNREIVRIPQKGLPVPLLPDDNFSDSAEEMAEKYSFLFVRLDSKDAADIVLDTPFLPAPLAITGEADAITYFKRRYCGKAPII